MSVFLKDPGSSNIDYTVNWSTYLSTGETVSASSWRVNSTGLTINASSLATPLSRVWIGGGTLGTVYRLSNKITTNQARADERHLIVRVEDR